MIGFSPDHDVFSFHSIEFDYSVLDMTVRTGHCDGYWSIIVYIFLSPFLFMLFRFHEWIEE
jgi:hypothetical protein